MKRRAFTILKFALMAYGIIGIAVYYLQDYILFHPEQRAKDEKWTFDIPHREINVPFNDNANMNVVQFMAADSPRGVVLYFHGNRKNIEWYARYANNFTKHGYEVWMIDYPGYGKSTGTLTEESLYAYAEQLYKLALPRFKPGNIILYGKSMGTGIAAWLATRKNCQQLVLETPYYSMRTLVQHYLPVYPVSRIIHYNLPTYSYLPEVIVPVTIFHGTHDGVIPYSQAERLKPLLKKGDALVTIPGGSHNNLNDYPQFHQKLDSLLEIR